MREEDKKRMQDTIKNWERLNQKKVKEVGPKVLKKKQKKEGYDFQEIKKRWKPDEGMKQFDEGTQKFLKKRMKKEIPKAYEKNRKNEEKIEKEGRRKNDMKIKRIRKKQEQERKNIPYPEVEKKRYVASEKKPYKISGVKYGTLKSMTNPKGKKEEVYDAVGKWEKYFKAKAKDPRRSTSGEAFSWDKAYQYEKARKLGEQGPYLEGNDSVRKSEKTKKEPMKFKMYRPSGRKLKRKGY